MVLKRTVGFKSTFRSVCSDCLSPEDDQSILIERLSWHQRFFWEPPQLIRDSHYMVLSANLYISYFHHAKFPILLNCYLSRAQFLLEKAHIIWPTLNQWKGRIYFWRGIIKGKTALWFMNPFLFHFFVINSAKYSTTHL